MNPLKTNYLAFIDSDFYRFIDLDFIDSFIDLFFIDSGAYQVKGYDPVNKVVTVLAGSGQKGNEDGTAKSCTFV